MAARVAQAAKTVRSRTQAGVRRISEAQMQAGIMDTARKLGFFAYHTTYAIGSERGYPDLTICGHGRFWMLELKGPMGSVSDAQEAWIAALQDVGVDARIVWPGDYEGIIEELKSAMESDR